jgi:hypothetical protein
VVHAEQKRVEGAPRATRQLENFRQGELRHLNAMSESKFRNAILPTNRRQSQTTTTTLRSREHSKKATEN